MTADLRDPWLVAAWPGMGGVALIAGTYLVEQLGAQRVSELPPGEHFDVQQVQVKEGIFASTAFPKSTFYAWKDPAGRRDLVVFLGEAQPASKGYAFCERLLAAARDLGVVRVFTFASMATPIHPRGTPRVFVAATGAPVLEELQRQHVEVLSDGEISGLNGVLVAAAAAHGLPGACILGEFPYFASGLPNPKASAAVLRVFTSVAGLSLDMTHIDGHATAVERRLVELLEKLQDSLRAQKKSEGQEEEAEEASSFTTPSFGGEEEGEEHEEEGAAEEGAEAEEGTLDASAVGRIEALFEQARKDRTRALELKAELDRLGAFKAYEDRFLDLFKRGE